MEHSGHGCEGQSQHPGEAETHCWRDEHSSHAQAKDRRLQCFAHEGGGAFGRCHVDIEPIAAQGCFAADSDADGGRCPHVSAAARGEGEAAGGHGREREYQRGECGGGGGRGEGRRREVPSKEIRQEKQRQREDGPLSEGGEHEEENIRVSLWEEEHTGLRDHSGLVPPHDGDYRPAVLR